MKIGPEKLEKKISKYHPKKYVSFIKHDFIKIFFKFSDSRIQSV
jgi:hypothetical protein